MFLHIDRVAVENAKFASFFFVLICINVASGNVSSQGLDADALAHMGEKDDAAAVIMSETSRDIQKQRNILSMYEGNVKEEQVLKLQGKVEVVVKKVASLLQLLPKLGERFGVTMQQMTQHVMPGI